MYIPLTERDDDWWRAQNRSARAALLRGDPPFPHPEPWHVDNAGAWLRIMDADGFAVCSINVSGMHGLRERLARWLQQKTPP